MSRPNKRGKLATCPRCGGGMVRNLERRDMWGDVVCIPCHRESMLTREALAIGLAKLLTGEVRPALGYHPYARREEVIDSPAPRPHIANAVKVDIGYGVIEAELIGTEALRYRELAQGERPPLMATVRIGEGLYTVYARTRGDVWRRL